MTFLLGRDGKISVFRASLLAIAIGGLFIVGAIVSFQIDQASHQSPLDIETYPGAVSWGGKTTGRTERSVYYLIPNVDPETVVAYYQQKLNEFYGTNPDTESSKPADQQEPNYECLRFPRTGNVDNYIPDTGTVPYQYKCTFDRSGFQSTQVTVVVIQPGVSNSSDPNFTNTEGQTVVEYQQRWQP